MRGAVMGAGAAAAFLLAGCATGATGASSPRTPSADPLYSLRLADPEFPEEFAAPEPGRPLAYRVEVRFASRGRGVVRAPVLVVLPRQRARVSVANRISFLRSFETEMDGAGVIANPVVARTTEGLLLEIAVRPVEGRSDRVLLAYRASVSDLRRPLRTLRMALVRGGPEVSIQLPATETSEVEAVRVLSNGVTGLLGVLPSPEGGGPVDVFARVVPVGFPGDAGAAAPAAPGAEESPGDGDLPGEGTLLARLAEGGEFPGIPGRLSLRAMIVRDSFPPYAVLDAGATEAVLRAEGTREIRALGLVTSLDPGVRMGSRLDEAFVQDFDVRDEGAGVLRGPILGTLSSGISAAIGPGGDLDLQWTTSPSWGIHEDVVAGVPVRIELPESRILSASVPVVPGRRLVSMGRTREGGTAAVLVEFRPEASPR